MIKYDEPRTWWRVTKWTRAPEPHKFIGETDKFLINHRGRRTAKSCGYDTYHETIESAESDIAAREAFAQQQFDASNRKVVALAACEGVATEHLTPGCVAKLFNAISLIACSQTINENAKDYLTAGCMQQIAEAALAAMKGE